MNTENSLVTSRNNIDMFQNMSDLRVIAEALSKSGYFVDAHDISQCITKILAGRELGISPIASMTGVYIVKGKPSMGANLIAACVKKSGKYNYRVMEHSEKICKIDFFEKEEGKFVQVGESTFTIEDARKAGTQNLDKFPRNMLFARAMSNGAKWYCADIFAGGVYTPDELGATVVFDQDGEIAHVVETPVVNVVEGEAVHVEEVTPEPAHGMTLEEASALHSDTYNKSYGELTDEELNGTKIGLSKLLKTGLYKPEKQSQLEQKLEAVKLITESRKA